MITYTVEINDIDEFPAWGGGLDWLEAAREAGCIDEVSAYIEALTESGFPEPFIDKEINDILRDDVALHRIILRAARAAGDGDGDAA